MQPQIILYYITDTSKQKEWRYMCIQDIVIDMHLCYTATVYASISQTCQMCMSVQKVVLNGSCLWSHCLIPLKTLLIINRHNLTINLALWQSVVPCKSLYVNKFNLQFRIDEILCLMFISRCFRILNRNAYISIKIQYIGGALIFITWCQCMYNIILCMVSYHPDI